MQPNAGGATLKSIPEAFGIWRQLNRYGGVRWGWQAGGAFIGFRDGLDLMDTARFSEAEYGEIGPLSASGTPRPAARTGEQCK